MEILDCEIHCLVKCRNDLYTSCFQRPSSGNLSRITASGRRRTLFPLAVAHDGDSSVMKVTVPHAETYDSLNTKMFTTSDV